MPIMTHCIITIIGEDVFITGESICIGERVQQELELNDKITTAITTMLKQFQTPSQKFESNLVQFDDKRSI